VPLLTWFPTSSRYPHVTPPPLPPGLELDQVKLLMKHAIRPARLRLRRYSKHSQLHDEGHMDSGAWGIDLADCV
jgi:hypothetical protein